MPASRSTRLTRAVVLLLGLSLAAGAHVVMTPSARAVDQVIEIAASEMTFIRKGLPKKNYAAYSTLVLSKQEYRTLLLFDTAKVPASATVVAAQLRLAVKTTKATKPGVDVRATGTAWKATKVTWATRPAVGAARLNPAEAGVAKRGKTLTTVLSGLTGTKTVSKLAFSLAYTQTGTPVDLAKTTKPVLRLTIRTTPKTPTTPTAPTTEAATPTQPVTSTPTTPTPTVPAVPDQRFELRPSGMTFTAASTPAVSYARHDYLAISNAQYRTYLLFDTSSIPTGMSIVSASLQTSIRTSAATAPGLDIRSTGTAWDPATLTADNAPAAGAEQLNPADATIAKAAVTQTSSLTGLARRAVGPKVALVVGYTQPGVEVHAAKTPSPVLHLTVRPTSALDETTDAEDGSHLSAGLPYAVAKPGSSTKKVFAHYFPPYPISIDNVPAGGDYYARHYLQPSGEDGKFAAVGGLLRDRPLPREPLGGDYRAKDVATEIKQAGAAGVDGFMVNIMGWGGSQSWEASLRVAKAAAELDSGFVAVPNIDMTASAGTASVEVMASHLKDFYASPGAYRLPDGRYLLSAFKAEAKPASFYASLASTLKSRHGVSVAFTGVFLSLSDAQVRAYAPVSYAMSVWGGRSVDVTRAYADRVPLVHSLGVRWMAPVSVQDVRHAALTYAESGNTEQLRASWQRAISDGADMAQLVTWNDYSESTHFSPSAGHGNAFLDLSGYYATQFKTGAAPALTRDELIVTHRVQSVRTQPRKQTAVMSSTLGGSRTTPRDTAEVLCLCKSPASVSMTVGGTTVTKTLPAGVSAYTAPLKVGNVSASASRNGVSVGSVVSRRPVLAAVDWWDLQYHAASSRP